MKHRVSNIETEMYKFNDGMTNLSNFVKVIKLIIIRNIFNTYFITCKHQFHFSAKLHCSICYFSQMKSINVYDFFPIQDDAMLEKFLSQDSQYEERKDQFSSIIINAIKDNSKKFMGAVVSAVFSEEYVTNHRWPTLK